MREHPDVLVMSHAKVGDFLLITPFLNILAESLPGLRIGVPDALFELFEELEIFPAEAMLPNAEVKRELASGSNNNYLDLTYPLLNRAIDFPGGHGLSKASFTGPRHVTEAYFEALREYFGEALPGPYAKPRPYLDPELDAELLAARDLRPFAYFTVHAGSDHPPKNWDLARFEDFVEQMHAEFPEIPCVSLVGPCDEPLFQNRAAPPQFRVLRESFRNAAQLLAGSLFHVDNDSGIHHLAGVLDVPTISVWGPTGPGTWGSLSDRNFIHWGGPACPDHCGGAAMAHCEDRVCLRSVQPEDLLASSRKILSAYDWKQAIAPPGNDGQLKTFFP